MENEILIVQGDCILKRCGNYEEYFIDNFKDIPNEVSNVQGNLLLKGDTNSHALYGGEFQLFKDDTGRIFVEVKQETTLDHVKDHLAINPVHAEHHAQTVPVGKWFVDELLEFDHLKNESRRVID